MAKDAKVGVHGALEPEDILLCWFMMSRDDILPFNGIEKVALGAVGNVNAVGLYYCAEEFHAF